VINRRMNARGFLFYTHAGLIVIGALLLLQAIPHASAQFSNSEKSLTK
jgi:hypothetical protein